MVLICLHGKEENIIQDDDDTIEDNEEYSVHNDQKVTKTDAKRQFLKQES